MRIRVAVLLSVMTSSTASAGWFSEDPNHRFFRDAGVIGGVCGDYALHTYNFNARAIDDFQRARKLLNAGESHVLCQTSMVNLGELERMRLEAIACSDNTSVANEESKWFKLKALDKAVEVKELQDSLRKVISTSGCQ